jgi:hypothetical protein
MSCNGNGCHVLYAGRLPNHALEPTPTVSARASLRLLARLTASVRRLCQRYSYDR